MKNYLSFGGGVNSVAMYLLLMEQGVDFEAVFVDHGADWPETYEYLDYFNEWVRKNNRSPVTILKPDVQGFDNLYEYCLHYKIVPSFMFRWCTAKFKIGVIHKYCSTPCFQFLGIDSGESKRAKISTQKGVENRFPLIEAELDRAGCVELIKKNGLKIPMKSGCFFCPYQKVSQWRELRIKHPDLFCKTQQLEKINMEYRKSQGKKPLYLSSRGKSLKNLVGENQRQLFEQDELPPCQCSL